MVRAATFIVLLLALPRFGVAAPIDVSKCSMAARKAVAVSGHDSVLVTLPTGESAAIQVTTTGLRKASYKWRYRASATAPVLTGAGSVFEDYVLRNLPNGDTVVMGRRNSVRDYYVEAGPIRIFWSAKDRASGWLYYCPAMATVLVRTGNEFESKP